MPDKASLHVTSDVEGASVFLNRNYVGSAPLTIAGIDPGERRLNVSAQGYEGYAETITVAPGANEVAVRFREVRLNTAVPVVHKHGIGSCDGRLIADLRGIRFETSKGDDAFQLGFDQLGTFEIDYVKHTLKMKKRGGQTWNFTDREPTADALFVFHRDVDQARQRLAR